MPRTAVPPSGTPMSWEEYDRLPGEPPSEYVDGRVVMVPTPTWDHQQVCGQLYIDLRERFRGHDFDVVMGWGWKPTSDEFVPDVMVHPRTREKNRFTGTPLLVVEVLSTNRNDDLVKKAFKYAAAGAPSYWIVDLRDSVADAFILRDGTYEPLAHLTGDEDADIPLGPTSYLLSPSSLLQQARE